MVSMEWRKTKKRANLSHDKADALWQAPGGHARRCQCIFLRPGAGILTYGSALASAKGVATCTTNGLPSQPRRR